jgi:hypothetical protein
MEIQGNFPMPGGRRKRRAGGRKPREGKLPRSGAATLRLDPKLRYFLELAARHQHRTLSSYLESAAEQSLKEIKLRSPDGSDRFITELMGQLWDADEATRFVKLASDYPDLLDYRDQILWKLIRENQFVRPRSPQGQMAAEPDISRLRSCWPQFVAVAEGEADRSILPGEHDSTKPFPTARQFDRPEK